MLFPECKYKKPIPNANHQNNMFYFSFCSTLVRVGEWNLDTAEDCIGMNTYRSCSLPPQDRQVEQTIPHPEYVRNSQGIFNDIALLRLSSPVTFNSKYLQIFW